MTDIGGLNDKGFNALAAKGSERRQEAARRHRPRLHLEDGGGLHPEPVDRGAPGVRPRDRVTASSWATQTAAVAKRFPDTKFAIIDFPWVALKGKPKNVRGLIFKEAEAGYLAGVAAATVAKGQPVASVGGQAVPAVVAFLAGYKAWRDEDRSPARSSCSGYSQDFVDQAKCKEIALNQIQQGAKVVFAGRRRLRPRRPPGGEGDRASGGSASTPTSRTSARTS